MKGQSSVPRDHTLDIVRGIAIVTMVGANLAILLPEPHSPVIRWYSSFAAPIFVTLAGTMMALAVNRNQESKHPVSYFIKRGLFLLCVAAMIDIVAWNFVPFMGFDVLYLLGLSLPALFLSAHLGANTVLFLAVGIFAVTPVLQNVLGYSSIPYMVDLADWRTLSTLDPSQVARHWLVDGWFPLFPWLGYGLFGVYLGKYRWHGEEPVRGFASLRITVVVAFAFVLGALLMIDNPGPLHSRDGFSELFYPASIGFILVSLSVVVSAISLIDYCPNVQVWSLFRAFGEASLFMYAVHSMIVGALWFTYGPHLSGREYFSIYGSLLVFLFGCGLWLRRVRRSYPQIPTALKWIVGG